MYTRNDTLLGFSSSSVTGGPFLIADYATLSVSIVTITTASPYTIQMSNADGFTAAIPEGSWSNVTLITAQGMYNIDPGPRWIRVLQTASNSSATVTIAGAVRS